MSDSASTHGSTSSLPAGRWRVEQTGSRIGFTARGMWGLATVHGTFSDFTGTLDVDDATVRGVLEIAATSLNTGNAKRDTHLRSPDFFDVARHPTVTFSLDSAAEGRLHGVLSIGGTELALDAPLTVELVSADRLTLGTALAVDRDAAGVGWSKMGMIRGQAQLNAEVTLVSDQSAR